MSNEYVKYLYSMVVFDIVDAVQWNLTTPIIDRSWPHCLNGKTRHRYGVFITCRYMKFIQENMLGCWRTSFSFNLTEYDLHLSFIKNTALSPKVLKNCQNCQILSICHIRAICSCMVWFFISGETNACITRNYSLLCFAIFRNRCDSCRAHRDNQNKNVHRGKQRWPFRSWSAGDGTGWR